MRLLGGNRSTWFRSKSEKANTSVSYIAFWMCFRVQVLVFSRTQMFCIQTPVQSKVFGGENPQQCLIKTFQNHHQSLTWPCSSPSTEQMDAFKYCGRCHFCCVHLPKMMCSFWHEIPPHRLAVKTFWQEAVHETRTVTNPFLAHLSKLKDRYMACNSLGTESNPASCQCSYVLSYLRCDQDGEAWGREVSRAKNKSSVFSQLFQLRCLKTFKCEAKSCLMQSSHRSWSCEVWSDYSIQIPC